MRPWPPRSLHGLNLVCVCRCSRKLFSFTYCALLPVTSDCLVASDMCMMGNSRNVDGALLLPKSFNRGALLLCLSFPTNEAYSRNSLSKLIGHEKEGMTPRRSTHIMDARPVPCTPKSSQTFLFMPHAYTSHFLSI